MRTLLVVRVRQKVFNARLLITFKKSLSPPISIAFVKCVIAKVKLLAAQAAAPSSFSSRLVIALIDLSQLRDASMSEEQWSLRAIRLASHTYRRKCNRSLKAETFDLFQDLELGLFFSSLHQIRERFHKRSKNRTTEGDFFEIRTWIDPGSRWERVGKIKKNQKNQTGRIQESSSDKTQSSPTVFPSLHPKIESDVFLVSEMQQIGC